MDADLADEVILVTGGTDGIGRATARRLAGRGATVLITGRDRRKAKRTLGAIRGAHPAADGEAFLVDFADRRAVYELARTVRDRHDRLVGLVNNAGTKRQTRELVDGWGDEPVEATFAVNHLAPFLLTNLLVPLLGESAPARVVVVSSEQHRVTEFDLESITTQPGFDGERAYADSKFANLLFTYELAERLRGTGVTADAVHPGYVPRTSLTRNLTSLAGLRRRVRSAILGRLPTTDDVADGARAVEHAVTSPDLEDVTGAYLVDGERRESAPRTYDRELRSALWAMSADLTGVSPEVPAVDPLAVD